ncbi:type II restriction enzyme [Psychrobacter pygoscelis]|uniref:type II restriction enzyme n=1 Tax=Psychrobacter pygoscelis TaxID=2488563 RepID=UPI00103D1301|nr:transcriptional regulator [Psychrobacter pygoscelis]
MSNNKNDVAWRKLFEEDNLLEKLEIEDEFIISSERINQLRQSRLMTKFDSRKDLPEIFRELGLSILPVSRGTYKVGRFSMFHNFEDYDTPKRIDKIEEVEFPPYIETIDPNLITSESSSVLCADLCSILNNFTKEEDLFSTISGRMGSGEFDFHIKGKSRVYDFNVKNSQIEIDAGYEGLNNIYLIEAKNTLSKDFIIRQIYYPYRTWLNKSLNKEIKNLYLTYSNGIFYLREYVFEDEYDPLSLKLIKSKRYSIINKELTLDYLKEILQSNLSPLNSQGAPFPQADDFNKVINLCEELLKKQSIDYDDEDLSYSIPGLYKSEISEIYDFTSRQADYYANAARYLGLVSINKKFVTLTELGLKVMQLPLTEKQIEFAKLILSSSPFAKTFKAYLENNGSLSLVTAKEVVASCEIDNLNTDSNTFPRRCLTVKSWIEWIITQIKVS